ncbi:transposable element Tc1 transposase, partial [Elysia marginata]
MRMHAVRLTPWIGLHNTSGTGEFNWLDERKKVWNKHMFSDESKFLLERQDGRKRVFRRVNERLVPQCLSQARAFGGGSVMVWGGISAA